MWAAANELSLTLSPYSQRASLFGRRSVKFLIKNMVFVCQNGCMVRSLLFWQVSLTLMEKHRRIVAITPSPCLVTSLFPRSSPRDNTQATLSSLTSLNKQLHLPFHCPPSLLCSMTSRLLVQMGGAAKTIIIPRGTNFGQVCLDITFPSPLPHFLILNSF